MHEHLYLQELYLHYYTKYEYEVRIFFRVHTLAGCTSSSSCTHSARRNELVHNVRESRSVTRTRSRTRVREMYAMIAA